ncbi:YbjN domain-containing protein [Mycolicibacterium psychrotolerans]|uniref:YbjN domain-containing protein n=1 Tax=Mycolicibacterium psychrotolerans TaxID=216929 RepID=UPI003D6658A1
MNTVIGAEVIEGYVNSRQLRHFCGHHDDEVFFLVNAYHGRLHVHLQPSESSIQITITAERYYPADHRTGVAALVQKWNGTHTHATATVFPSSDPRLVGVVAERRYRATDGDFGPFVDQAVQAAIDLFGRLGAAVPLSSDHTHLLDAG